AVLDAVGVIVELELGEHGGAGALGEGVDAHQRAVADQGGGGVVDTGHESGILLLVWTCWSGCWTRHRAARSRCCRCSGVRCAWWPPGSVVGSGGGGTVTPAGRARGLAGARALQTAATGGDAQGEVPVRHPIPPIG